MTRLAERLTQEFGRGFGYPNLYRMVKFFLKFPDPEILSTLSRQFSWSHFLEFIKIEDPLKRDIHIAEYWLQLPPREVLQARLHEAMVAARARLERT